MAADILFLICMLLLWCVCLADTAVSIVFIYLTAGAGFMHSSPSVPSSGTIKKALIKEISAMLENTSGKKTVDLGSGWGTLLLPLAKKFPQHEFTGIEKGFLPFYASRFRARKLKNLTFIRQDFFVSEIADYDIIFVFLLGSTLEKLSRKIKNETKTGAVVIANRFPLKDAEPYKEVNLGSKYYTYYVYVKGSEKLQ